MVRARTWEVLGVSPSPHMALPSTLQRGTAFIVVRVSVVHAHAKSRSNAAALQFAIGLIPWLQMKGTPFAAISQTCRWRLVRVLGIDSVASRSDTTRCPSDALSIFE